MNNADKVLKIADDNGVDWFGHRNNSLQPDRVYSYSLRGDKVMVEYLNKKDCEYWKALYSLADVATNKSFYAAISKYLGRDIFEELQKLLILSCTFNDGENFWEIICEFIGETVE